VFLHPPKRTPPSDITHELHNSVGLGPEWGTNDKSERPQASKLRSSAFEAYTAPGGAQ
jgi:hypothetical protein